MLRKLIVALAICLPLTACETMRGGNADLFSNEALKKNLVVGKTTPEQVRTIYGTPDYTSEGPNGPSMWAYDADKTMTNTAISSAASMLGFGSAASTLSDKRSLSIFFERNRVSSYSISDTKPQ